MPDRPSIYVSFPALPNQYPSNCHWHAQVSHFVFHALKVQFGSRVLFSEWNEHPPLTGADAFVSFLPHVTLRHWKRSVLIDNENFDNDKWLFGKFKKYGLNEDTDINGIKDLYVNGQFSRIVLTNDVTLRKLSFRDESVWTCFEHFKNLCPEVRLHPHPTDKTLFSRYKFASSPPDWPRMLIYHGGPRKNSAELIGLLCENGYKNGFDFDVTGGVDKNNTKLLQSIADKYLFVANTSFSETGPVNMMEFLTAGHLVYGHEEWWDGAGNTLLLWSYDPLRRNEMIRNLSYLLDPNNLPWIMRERERIWQWWMNRTDTDWNCVLTDLCSSVERLLCSAHPSSCRDP